MTDSHDVVIIGAGIVGLATAMKLLARDPKRKVAVVEKEEQPGSHQTGHNSGVIHSGIYYRPGSLKALLCVSGSAQLVRFCRDHGVSHEVCGKVVVATRPEEAAGLHELHRRGTANGVPGLRLLKPGEVRAFEPHVRCLSGLHVPTTGIVDFQRVAHAYGAVFRDSGGTVYLGHRVEGIRKESAGVRIETNRGSLFTRMIVNCGGLYSDHIARMAGVTPPCRIVPFRGEYYQIRPEKSHLVRNLIYPVPDPRFPFLGVHFTRMINGKVEAGPNAVLAFAREGYRKSSVCLPELMEVLAYGGFWRMASRYWRPGLQEVVRSHSRDRFTKALQELVPEIGPEDLAPGGAGVRAQALGHDGKLLDDFVVMRSEHMVHVLNAPSPAATSSLAIADHILDVVKAMLH